MRILVTGATGFIGSHFVNTASAAGHDVIAVRRPGSVPRVPVADSVQWIDKPLASVTTDDMRECHAVVHFAAEGVSPGLIPVQPKDSMNVGRDELTAAGDYTPPNPLQGNVGNLKVISGEAGAR